MNRYERLLRRWANGTLLSGYLAAKAESAELVRELDRKRKRKAARSLPRRKAEAVTKAERQAKSEAIRAAVFARAAGRCEVPRCTVPPDEWHHIASGSSRKIEEAEDSTCAICIPHHRLAQAGDRETLEQLKLWAIRGGFLPAARALDRRLTKIDEARRTNR